MGRSTLNLSVVVALITATLVAQGSSAEPAARTPWAKQEPISSLWAFADVDMISTMEGWAVSHPVTGDHATIFHTIHFASPGLTTSEVSAKRLSRKPHSITS